MLVAERHSEGLKNPWRLPNLTQELKCQFPQRTRELKAEVSQLSDKVSLEIYGFGLDRQKMEGFRINKIPAVVVERERMAE